ncbi:hypothetical protein ACIOJD_22685 [Streptomyces sp. NPDC088116]|uniref:hypothetical protein n=1 Tax=Streptomyces sp. NPDC088116 TaxID=3365825 RepID=UPI00382814DC
MATHVATPGRHRVRRHHAPRTHTPPRRPPSRLAVAAPLFVGVAYGAYASFIARGGGPASFGQLALALISGVVMAALVFGLVRVQNSLMRELRAGAWGVLVGGSLGFLYSLTGHSVLLSSGIGLAIGAATVIATFYVYYTREP